MQRVSPGIGDVFGPAEEALQETFLPALFQGTGEGSSERGVTRLSVKQAGLALPDPTKTAPEKWTAYYVITGHLFVALRGQVKFRTADHSARLQEGRTAVQRRSVLPAEEALEETIQGGPVQGACRLLRATKTGDCLTMQPSTVNGT